MKVRYIDDVIEHIKKMIESEYFTDGEKQVMRQILAELISSPYKEI